jgi:hypothetical protein
LLWYYHLTQSSHMTYVFLFLFLLGTEIYIEFLIEVVKVNPVYH